MAIINSRSALEFHERFFDWTNQKAKKQGLIKGVDQNNRKYNKKQMIGQYCKC